MVRKRNEDSICINPELSFFAVADGMGGHLAGEVASGMALELVAEQLKGCDCGDMETKLHNGVLAANRKIYDASRDDLTCRGMGTTITAAIIKKREMVLAHVGDSRAYLIRGDRICKVTEDHSLVQEMLKQGGITKEEARDHPHRNVLIRALGTDPLVQVDMIKINLKKGDIILLCSDGLSGLVDDDDILKLVKSSGSPGEAVDSLVSEALRRGGTDNISVIVVEIDE
ncbi:MAG: Stp1/IreP family PP2C-type Ser/Thr phosphatase [Bacillota bacterium]